MTLRTDWRCKRTVWIALFGCGALAAVVLVGSRLDAKRAGGVDSPSQLPAGDLDSYGVGRDLPPTGLVGSGGIAWGPSWWSRRIEDRSAMDNSEAVLQVDALPDYAVWMLVEQSWDEDKTAQLEAVLTQLFDEDRDGVLNGLERARAIAAVRDRALQAYNVQGEASLDDSAIHDLLLHSVESTLQDRDGRLYLTREEKSRLSRASDNWTMIEPYKVEEPFSPPLVAVVARLLARFDRDSDGTMSPDEQRRFVKRHGASSSLCDLNNDGRVETKDLELFVGAIEYLEAAQRRGPP